MSSHFHMEDIGLLRYFLRIEVIRSLKGLSCLNENTLLISGMLGSKLINTPIDPNIRFGKTKENFLLIQNSIDGLLVN